MTFTILHTSARPHECFKVYDAWMKAAEYPAGVQYILCVDPRWGFSADKADYNDLPANITVVFNNGRRCYVEGVNLAAREAVGDVFIVNADDQYPCEGWDHKIFDAVKAAGKLNDEFVVRVSTGTPDEHERGVMVMPILSRSRYQRLGHVFYPKYESMCADNDFCEKAQFDNVVVEARDLVFPHHHWMKGDRPIDDQDRAQNRREAYQLGSGLLERRRACGFSDVDVRRTVALCYAGEHFEGPWHDAMMSLYAHMLVDLDLCVLRIRPENWTNVFISREDMRKGVLKSEIRADLVFWIDDDNICSAAHFDQMLSLIDARPDVDGVFAWCWIHDKQKKTFFPSVGNWAPDKNCWDPFPPSFAHESVPREFETGGLPCCLLRTEALEKAGDGCFLPVVDASLQHGMTGEDSSFFRAAEKGGCKFIVDPTIRVPHLKWVTVDPVDVSDGAVPVRVACMIRAKNEGRWIARSVASVKALCGENVFVMEDNSTDNTAEEAARAGAVVLTSPFASMGLDERRDKNWLLKEVISRCNPDWIFMPDGDEELEPDGCAKIRAVLEKNPPIDVFGLRFLYFWDSFDQVRSDGQYRTLLRRSLFRPVPGLEFKSYYEGKGANDNHVGLHVSNAPGVGFNGLRDAPMQVFLYHYGYVFREDRIRKFQWITKLDPANDLEDFYKHTIQGDGPITVFDGRVFDIKADEKLKHAGPLTLKRIPNRMVPKFEVLPRPFAAEVACGPER